MEIPIKMDDLGVPLFSETPISEFYRALNFCREIGLVTSKVYPLWLVLTQIWAKFFVGITWQALTFMISLTTISPRDDGPKIHLNKRLCGKISIYIRYIRNSYPLSFQCGKDEVPLGTCSPQTSIACRKTSPFNVRCCHPSWRCECFLQIGQQNIASTHILHVWKILH